MDIDEEVDKFHRKMIFSSAVVLVCSSISLVCSIWNLCFSLFN